MGHGGRQGRRRRRLAVHVPRVVPLPPLAVLDRVNRQGGGSGVLRPVLGGAGSHAGGARGGLGVRRTVGQQAAVAVCRRTPEQANSNKTGTETLT